MESNSSAGHDGLQAARATLVECTPGKTQIGFIGLGVMGRSMATHLLRAGYRMKVYNRTPQKCAPLEKLGAVVARSYREAAEGSDVVISIVGHPEDVEQVYLGPEGALEALREGGVIVDMTTSTPSLAQRLHEAAQKKRVFSLDAPVSGGDVGAREARLSIMAGGDKEAFLAVSPVFEILGKQITFCGGPGTGQHTKMTNQILIATNMIGVVEALLYARRMGLDLEKTLAAVSTGAAGSWSLANYAPRILRGDYEPGFFVEHFVKDMQIALTEARRANLALPGLALAHQLYVSVMALGFGKKGIQALQLALDNLNNLRQTNN
ncbi:NAD binding domain of 6-phosphogluconate dehydrogenase [Neospora caninum Liverpool]|uniref:NAD binding domain of 6-phosphogluconate dehydrogenase n=1 Tax=Neospora caninum (strain Liverpool) TaxID=572307 RepID=F0VG18_NEOCL|nr:NAD binding domain of 6-phosphogluconate dehydrogenase [Neospora caninum Liverpool]CBZ52662.1 NAD binding domain of 6-phosphogluconate dehydrogenase [Neospora caninum Liverpool]CEL66639.1 TPA: NAD binding domain of 6-phosphogluconate dehydrogenase, putative [Neospora caninum Liverpool]|eukprot:XP_003882694.1 NAD binding domain of 6-phosphogluconate dehydrogenase [Neospora caninum Liverpool]